MGFYVNQPYTYHRDLLGLLMVCRNSTVLSIIRAKITRIYSCSYLLRLLFAEDLMRQVGDSHANLEDLLAAIEPSQISREMKKIGFSLLKPTLVKFIYKIYIKKQNYYTFPRDTVNQLSKLMLKEKDRLSEILASDAKPYLKDLGQFYNYLLSML
jgi:hypothetical protein